MAGTTPQWTVNGKAYDKTSRGIINKTITLPATDICIPSMPDSSGKPISKVLAEMYVANLMTILEQLMSYQPSSPPATNLETELKGQIDTLNNFLSLIVNVSHGVTFDRDLISKILSQPKCEGIRCYFCAKGKDASPQSISITNCGISLVVVGVGADGKDLNWAGLSTAASPTLPGTVTTATVTDPDDDGTSPSLAGEYGTPPPPTLEEKKSNKNFALLTNALTLV